MQPYAFAIREPIKDPAARQFEKRDDNCLQFYNVLQSIVRPIGYFDNAHGWGWTGLLQRRTRVISYRYTRLIILDRLRRGAYFGFLARGTVKLRIAPWLRNARLKTVSTIRLHRSIRTRC